MKQTISAVITRIGMTSAIIRSQTADEAAAEPPATRQRGPAGFYATAVWLRAAFAGLRWEVHQAFEHDDLVVLHMIMSGRHTGNFATYQPGTATVHAVMSPTGKPLAVTQTHWFRTRDGMITEHWANRDDLAMARQAGLGAPSPGFLLRAAIAKRHALKAPRDTGAPRHCRTCRTTERLDAGRRRWFAVQRVSRSSRPVWAAHGTCPGRVSSWLSFTSES